MPRPVEGTASARTAPPRSAPPRHHMSPAFNGRAHFEPGEFISYFESVGARLGPHANAYTAERTVYVLGVPADRPEVVARGLTALADIAGALTIDPAQVEKERGVVIEGSVVCRNDGRRSIS